MVKALDLKVTVDLEPTKEFLERVGGLLEAIKPLVMIAHAYDCNNLDDEARKYWGPDDNRTENKTPAKDIELYQGRGGKRLLTLEDCLKAREALREFNQLESTDVIYKMITSHD